MHRQLPYVAEPLQIGVHTARNRIVVPPMADIVQKIPEGFITDYILKRYQAYAGGGAGMITVEGSNISSDQDVRDAIAVWDDAYIPGLSQLARAVRSGGAVGLIQLMHGGLAIMQEDTIAAISRRDFLAYKEKFIRAARRCQQAGFDGIELHGAHGYYLNQVVETSERDDEYGGSFSNRIRLLIELVHDIKQVCGRDFLVSVRFGYPTFSGLVQMACELEKAGADLLSISTGRHAYQHVPAAFPMDAKIYAAWQVKQAVHIPVLAVGNIRDGEDAEAILKWGYADLVAVGRSQLADPAWTRHCLSGIAPVCCFRCKPCRWFKNSALCPARNLQKTT